MRPIHRLDPIPVTATTNSPNLYECSKLEREELTKRNLYDTKEKLLGRISNGNIYSNDGLANLIVCVLTCVIVTNLSTNPAIYFENTVFLSRISST